MGFRYAEQERKRREVEGARLLMIGILKFFVLLWVALMVLAMGVGLVVGPQEGSPWGPSDPPARTQTIGGR